MEANELIVNCGENDSHKIITPNEKHFANTFSDFSENLKA
jgi:hypothetical protein